MRISLSSVTLALVLLSVTTSAFAQDGTVDPEAGDVAAEPIAGEQPAAASVETNTNVGPLKKPISVGLLLGYGISLEDGDGNPWGLGFGLRGGYNIDAIYLGARFIYYLGEDPVNIWELGIEGGYDFAVAEKVTVRPTLGLGIANITVDIPEIAGFDIGGSASESEFYLAPGVSALYDVNDSVFIGLEARFKLIMSDPTAKAITLFANGGMRF
jgi:opacity protein-like surface antigen